MNELQTEPAGKLYEIKLKEHLNESWADWLNGMVFTHESNGTTTLTGVIIDQAALYGLLKKARDLGLSLISVTHIESDATDGAEDEIVRPSFIEPGSRGKMAP